MVWCKLLRSERARQDRHRLVSLMIPTLAVLHRFPTQNSFADGDDGRSEFESGKALSARSTDAALHAISAATGSLRSEHGGAQMRSTLAGLWIAQMNKLWSDRVNYW